MAIAALGLALRCYGFSWGLPNDNRLYSYHPDEITIVRHGLGVAAGSLNPHFFRYGSLFIYIAAALFTLAGGFVPLSLPAAHILTRTASLGFGMAQIWVVFILGRQLYGWRVGLAAAAILAVTPMAVMTSHWGTVDNCAAFFLLASAYYAARILDDDRMHNYALAGAFAGLSAATKYYGVVALLLVLAVHLRRAGFKLSELIAEKWLAAPLAAGVAFVVGCPFSVLSFGEFKRDFLAELAHKAQGGTIDLHGLPGLVFMGTDVLPTTLGHGLLVGLLVAVVWLMARRRPEDVGLVAWLAVLYVMGGSGKEIFARYAIPMLPFVALAVGALPASEKPEKWPGARSVAKRFTPRAVQWAIVAKVLLYTTACSIAYVGILGREDTRDWALREIRSRLPAHGSLGLMRTVWFYSPPVVRENGGPHSGDEAIWKAADRAGLKLYIIGRDTNYLDQVKPDLFVFSDIEREMEEVAHGHEVHDFIGYLGRSYECTVICRSEPRLGPLVFPDSHLHDWRYINPDIYVYVRRK